MLQNTKVSVRLFFLIGLSVFFMALLSGVALVELGLVARDFSVVTNNSVPSLYIISTVRGAMNRVVILEKRHILNNESDNINEIESLMAAKKEEVRTEMEKYDHQNLAGEGERAIYDTVRTRWDEYLEVHEEVIRLSRALKTEEARNLSGDKGTELFNRLAESVDQWAEFNVENSIHASDDAKATSNNANLFMILIPIVAAMVSVALGLVLVSSITRPINRMSEITARIAGGDLDQRADENESELGKMAISFNKMADNLRKRLLTEQEQRQHLQDTVESYVVYLNDVSRGNLARRLQVHSNGGGADDPLVRLGNNLNDMTVNLGRMIGQIREASGNLSSAATEILAATTQQVSGASEQSSAIAQTTTTVDEVKAIAEQSSVRAQQVATSSQRTVEVSRNGQRAVQDTIESMAAIKGRVEGIAENILALSEQTQQIGEIIATVNEIAAQSNMLALNASVEAARAGEHGKGFAVVALEVRNLAEQSRNATSQVKSILSEIQKATNATVMATEEGTKGVERGVSLAASAKDSIEELSRVIEEAAQTATQVAAGGQQQMAGVDQVAIAMQNINQATVQSLASTRQAERAAQNLNDLARQLTDAVTKYQL